MCEIEGEDSEMGLCPFGPFPVGSDVYANAIVSIFSVRYSLLEDSSV